MSIAQALELPPPQSLLDACCLTKLDNSEQLEDGSRWRPRQHTEQQSFLPQPRGRCLYTLYCTNSNSCVLRGGPALRKPRGVCTRELREPHVCQVTAPPSSGPKSYRTSFCSSGLKTRRCVPFTVIRSSDPEDVTWCTKGLHVLGSGLWHQWLPTYCFHLKVSRTRSCEWTQHVAPKRRCAMLMLK